MSNSAPVVAMFETHQEAERAIRRLQHSGFDMSKLSIIGRDCHTEEHVVGYYNAGDRMKCWGQFGAFWGAVWGILFGAAFFVLPGIGPVLMAGPFVALIVTAIEGAAVGGGISALGGALASIGVPNDRIVQYESELKIGKFMLVVHGNAQDAERASAELDTVIQTGAQVAESCTAVCA